MNWRDPSDVFGNQLQTLFSHVITYRGDPKSALAPFESILHSLVINYDQEKVDRLGWMGDELDEALESHGEVAPSVAHFCERLRELIGGTSDHTSNAGGMLLWVREIISSEHKNG